MIAGDASFLVFSGFFLVPVIRSLFFLKVIPAGILSSIFQILREAMLPDMHTFSLTVYLI